MPVSPRSRAVVYAVRQAVGEQKARNGTRQVAGVNPVADGIELLKPNLLAVQCESHALIDEGHLLPRAGHWAFHWTVHPPDSHGDGPHTVQPGIMRAQFLAGLLRYRIESVPV